jgi:hypothetical protein
VVALQKLIKAQPTVLSLPNPEEPQPPAQLQEADSESPTAPVEAAMPIAPALTHEAEAPAVEVEPLDALMADAPEPVEAAAQLCCSQYRTPGCTFQGTHTACSTLLAITAGQTRSKRPRTHSHEE